MEGSAPMAATGDARPEGRLVQAPCGPVLGVRAEASWMYLGIPFAQPPTGARRFQPPLPHPRWSAPLDASRWPAPPLQDPSTPAVVGPDAPPPSEDCLYLNVWTPREPQGCPVFVWVHGGANIAGSSTMSVFDGARFAAQGIVCVTITYRVGVFGFLELDELLGPAYVGSALNGLRDMAAALAWVQDNIAEFGGDPQRITIGGQSAGAKNIAALLASKASQVPLRGAILQSGGGQTVATRDEAHALARRVVAALPEDQRDGASLLALSGAQWLRAQNQAIAASPSKFPFRPVIDGDTLPDYPLQAIEAGAARGVRLLCGSTRDESPVGGPAAPRDGTVGAHQLANMTLDAFRPKYAQYAALYPALSDEARKYRALAAEEYGMPTLRIVEAQAACGGAAWMYRFDLPNDAGVNQGLCRHGSDLPLSWNKLDDPLSSHLGPTGDVATAVGATMHGAWVHFITHGTPSTSRFDWPRYDLVTRPSAQFAASAQVVNDLNRAERQLWQGWPSTPPRA